MAVQPANLNPSYITVRPEILSLVPESATDILDVGCSSGALGSALKSLVPGRTVTGIEYDEAYSRVAEAHLDRVFHADLNDFDWNEHFRGKQFDCMIFADVLEHIMDPWGVLREARNHLAPDGCVILSLPNIRHLSSFASIYLAGRFPRRSRGIHDATHLRWFTRSDMLDLCKQAGLDVVSATPSLRLRDHSGGRINAAFGRLGWLRSIPLISEFFAYQYVIKAIPITTS